MQLLAQMFKHQMNYLNKKLGFSLVELLVVIAVISTMMAILLPNLMGARERAQDSQKIQDLSAIKNGLRLYYNDHQAYPTPGAGNGALDSGFDQYISNIGTSYKYYQPNDTDSFVICTNLASGVGEEDTNSQLKCGINTVNVDFCGLGLANGVGKTGNNVYVMCAK